MKSKRLSRRDFLRLGALSAGGAALAACTPKTIVVTEKETVVVKEQVEKVVKETVVIEKVREEKEIRVLISAWVRAITPIDREVAAFNESHPGVKVILEDSSAGWDTKVLAQIRAGEPSWSANLGAQLNLARYVETEMVMPVGEYLEASSEPGAQGILDDFHPLPRADCTYKGELYGISWRVDFEAFTYNKKMTAAVGMEEWPQTWDGIEDLAVEIAKAYEEEDVWGLLLRRHVISGATDIFYTMVREPWRDDGILDITNPKFAEALKMIKRWQDMELCPTPPWQDQGGAHMTLFEAGKAGMICTPHIWGKWAMYVQGSDVISYPVPMPPTGGKTPSWATPSHLFRNAPHPAETMDFVIYVFGPQNERMIRSCIEGRGLPCWKSSFENIVPQVPDMAWQADMMGFIGDATPIAKTTTMGIQNDKIMAKIEDYLLGKIPDPEMAMQMALDEVLSEAEKQQVG